MFSYITEYNQLYTAFAIIIDMAVKIVVNE